jgi:hypothetical protein
MAAGGEPGSVAGGVVSGGGSDEPPPSDGGYVTVIGALAGIVVMTTLKTNVGADVVCATSGTVADATSRRDQQIAFIARPLTEVAGY